MTRPTNWAGNVTFSTADLRRPTSIAQLQEVVAGASRLRVLGTGHSFNELADSDVTMVSVAGLPPAIDVDSPGSRVRVAAGVRYGELGRTLQAAGFGLPNTGSLPHISVAGACATGTHGSGVRLGNLSTQVAAVEMVTADGSRQRWSRDSHPHTFDGMVLHLGTLGVVTAVELDLVPTFAVRQDVYDDVPHEDFLAAAEAVMTGGYSVSAFSTWRRPRTHQIWVKSVTDTADRSPAPALLGRTAAARGRHPVPGMPIENTTTQTGVPGPWNERLPHFRLEFTPSSGEELQSEYLLDRADLVAALRSLDDITDDIAAVLQVSELRTVAADTLWISPSQGRDSACLHFTWVADERAVLPVVAAIEARLAAFGARPHWGKVFTVPAAALSARYPRWADFWSLAGDVDPTGTFRNAMIDRLLRG